MKVDEHEKAYQEHLRNLNKAIEEGVEENQRNIGYNVSQGSVELFAIYLHKLHLIEGSGDQWDHRTFKTKERLQQKVPSAFPERSKILVLMEKIEQERLVVCYGRRKPKERMERMIESFHELRRIVNKNLSPKQVSHEQQK